MNGRSCFGMLVMYVADIVMQCVMYIQLESCYMWWSMEGYGGVYLKWALIVWVLMGLTRRLWAWFGHCCCRCRCSCHCRFHCHCRCLFRCPRCRCCCHCSYYSHICCLCRRCWKTVEFFFKIERLLTFFKNAGISMSFKIFGCIADESFEKTSVNLKIVIQNLFLILLLVYKYVWKYQPEQSILLLCSGRLAGP